MNMGQGGLYYGNLQVTNTNTKVKQITKTNKLF